MRAFLGGIAEDLDCAPIAIDGMAEHVRVLVRHPSDLSNADLPQNLKGRSSKWIHQTFGELRAFRWQ